MITNWQVDHPSPGFHRTRPAWQRAENRSSDSGSGWVRLCAAPDLCPHQAESRICAEDRRHVTCESRGRPGLTVPQARVVRARGRSAHLQGCANLPVHQSRNLGGCAAAAGPLALRAVPVRARARAAAAW
jgi:hypothetical protein